MEYKRIYLSPPDISGKELEYVQDAFNNNWIAPLGPNVDKFEKAICNYVESEAAVALNSGTAGIHLALKVLGVVPGDTVFCSTLTFAASCNPIVYEGAEPVFIDCELDSWNMSPQALEKAMKDADQVNKLPKAVIIVNLYGQSADMDSLLEICKRYKVPVIEDAAESLGASYKGQMSGTFGDIGVYSFNGNKIITTSGGGMVISSNKDYTDKIRYLSTQAREPLPYYEHKDIGYNYRLSNVCAGIGLGQLETLNNKIRRRKEIFNIYKEKLTEFSNVSMMPELEKGNPNYWLTVIRIKEKDIGTIIDYMNNYNIECRHAWKPMHLQPIYKRYKFYPHSKEQINSNKIFDEGLCLPSGSSLSDAELDFVLSKLVKAI